MASNQFRFYFSFRSPFAGIALYRLRRLPQFSDCDIEVVPVWPEVVFGGHMDNPTDNLFKLIYVFHDASRQAQDAGLDTGYLQAIANNFKIPENVDFSQQKVGIPMEETNWAQSHLGFLYAEDQGKGWAFADAVFAARFGFDGASARNVLDPEVLRDIATAVGLDATELLAAQDAPEYLERHKSMIAQSEQDGVFGVPFFVVNGAVNGANDRQVFWGNDRLGYLHQALSDAPQSERLGLSDLTQINRQ